MNFFMKNRALRWDKSIAFITVGILLGLVLAKALKISLATGILVLAGAFFLSLTVFLRKTNQLLLSEMQSSLQAYQHLASIQLNLLDPTVL